MVRCNEQVEESQHQRKVIQAVRKPRYHPGQSENRAQLSAIRKKNNNDET